MRPRVAITPVPRIGRSLRTRVVNASTPPSPLLSARRMMPTYLTEMTRASDQKDRDRVPRMLFGVTLTPATSEKQARRAYSGLVPISPNTTPIAASESAAVLVELCTELPCIHVRSLPLVLLVDRQQT